MSKVTRADWYFIVSATSIFVASILVSLWDFFVLQWANRHPTALNVLGLVLFGVGVSLRLVGKRTLSKSYSYLLHDKRAKPLVTSGIYKYIRHPIYLAGILYTTGVPLIFGSVYGFAIALGFIPCFLYRINVEERLLVQEFGDQYLVYVKRTKKLIPIVY